MFGPLALVVRLVGRIEISLADVHDRGCPALAEVELVCFEHPEGWAVHAWPVDPSCYQPYKPGNERQADLIDLFAVRGAVPR
jgi:hypothetical protein